MSEKHKWLVIGGHRNTTHQAPGSGRKPLGQVGCWIASILNADLLLQVPPPCKRKSELPWLEEARRPPAKMRRGDSQVSKVQSPMADCASPESQGCGQTCLAVDGVPQPSSSQLDREASPRGWYLRKNNKTPVYSGCLPADSCPQESHPGLVGKPSAGIRNASLGQSAKEETEPGQSKEKTQCQTQTSKQSQSLPKPSAHLCLQESQEERLQALRARIQSSMAKRLQARQTTMISFHTQHKSPGQQGELGPRRADTGPTSHSLPEAPAHPGSQKHPCLPSGAKGPKKAPAKRPAPLMAKALRDYSRRFYTN